MSEIKIQNVVDSVIKALVLDDGTVLDTLFIDIARLGINGKIYADTETPTELFYVCRDINEKLYIYTKLGEFVDYEIGGVTVLDDIDASLGFFKNGYDYYFSANHVDDGKIFVYLYKLTLTSKGKIDSLTLMNTTFNLSPYKLWTVERDGFFNILNPDQQTQFMIISVSNIGETETFKMIYDVEEAQFLTAVSDSTIINRFKIVYSVGVISYDNDYIYVAEEIGKEMVYQYYKDGVVVEGETVTLKSIMVYANNDLNDDVSHFKFYLSFSATGLLDGKSSYFTVKDYYGNMRLFKLVSGKVYCVTGKDIYQSIESSGCIINSNLTWFEGTIKCYI